MSDSERFLAEHGDVTRRWFLRCGVAGAAAALSAGRAAADRPPELAGVLEKLEPYFTPQDEFRDVSRGKPLPHSLPEEKKREVGLTRETWKLEVISDPEQPGDARQAAHEEGRHRARLRRRC